MEEWECRFINELIKQIMDFNKKYALITGASSGIGKATALHFAAQGVNLILCARREDRLAQTVSEIRQLYPIDILSLVVDVRKKEEVDALHTFVKEQQIVPTVLINNAGLAAGLDKLQEGKIDDWERMIDTNVKGLLYVTRAFLPDMIAKNEGHIVLIGSVAGHIVYSEGNVYNATKFAVRALNEAINMDLKGTAIRCCSIDPGACESDFSLVRFAGDENRAKKVYEGYQPLSPKDVADAIWYVCNAPLHVNITNLVIYPTAQRSPFVIDKKTV